jgi:hypothetical protein
LSIGTLKNYMTVANPSNKLFRRRAGDPRPARRGVQVLARSGRTAGRRRTATALRALLAPCGRRRAPRAAGIGRIVVADSGAKRLVPARGRGRTPAAPLVEPKVLRRDGGIETRYADRAVRVGDRLAVGRRKLVVLKQAAPSGRRGAASFLCLEVPPPPPGVRRRGEQRRAA